ncbi:hypothetical protein GW17_00038484 [Ensete ventricosum]|nr:hypothetical protein GW17_00038484 [Ensete ventricosum]
MDYPRAMLYPGVTQELVGEGELPKERTQSEVAEVLRCAGKGHTWRDRSPSMIGATGELDCSNAYIRLREPDKSEDKAEGRTSMESLIPYSHGGTALVVKGAEEVENAEANSRDFGLMQECSTRRRQFVVLYFFYSEE